MTEISRPVIIEGSTITVDAPLVAEGLQLRADAVPAMVRDGSLTCCFERGVGEDEGRFRLMFWHESLRLRVIVDQDGHVLKRTRLNYGGPRPIRRGKN